MVIQGTIIEVAKGDTGSLDYSQSRNVSGKLPFFAAAAYRSDAILMSSEREVLMPPTEAL